jgi:cytochrome c biogenesis factor
MKELLKNLFAINAFYLAIVALTAFVLRSLFKLNLDPELAVIIIINVQLFINGLFVLWKDKDFD